MIYPSLQNIAASVRPYIAISVLALLWMGGCARKNEDFIPSPDIAEQALEKVLGAWQAGKPAGEVAGTKPVVFATDTSRKKEQTLRSFQILGETPGSSGRTYAVILHLDNPVEKVKTQYIVVGIDPLWVFRQEDYELLMHWDHYMPEPGNDRSTTAVVTPEPSSVAPAGSEGEP